MIQDYEDDMLVVLVHHADTDQGLEELVITTSPYYGVRGSFVNKDAVLDAEDFYEEHEFMTRFLVYHMPRAKRDAHYQ